MTRYGLGIFLAAIAFGQQPTAQIAIDLNDRGNQASEKNDYAGAARYYRESSQIWLALGPDYSAHRAGTLMNEATVLCAAGDRTRGTQLFEEALALHRKSLGVHHKRTLENMNLLAANYLMLGEVQKAETLNGEALPIALDEFPDSLQAARCLELLSGILYRRDKIRDSVEPAERALAIAIRNSGDEGLEAALAYATTAEAHRAVGNTARALPLFRKAHQLYEKILGPNHPRVASVLSQEGLVAMEDGKLATAEELMLRSISILNRGCPSCLAELSVAKSNLGMLRLKQKRYHDAGETLSEALALREQFTTTPTVDLAASLKTLAVARKLEHRDADAAKLNQRAAVIMQFQ
jgi:tetratricopeptide (TPR) repeat protein